jgi:hypothetical protein
MLEGLLVLSSPHTFGNAERRTSFQRPRRAKRAFTRNGRQITEITFDSTMSMDVSASDRIAYVS